MGAKVFMPRIQTWVLVAAGACWLGLTALSVHLGGQEGFLAQMATQLVSTVAGVAFGVTGIGAIVQGWQMRQMRQRTGPIVLTTIGEAVEACGVLAGTYATAGSAYLHGAGALQGASASVLLAPPLLADDSDMRPLAEWTKDARLQYLKHAAASLGGDSDAETNGDSPEGAAPTAEDVRMLDAIREASAGLAHADAKLQRAVTILVDFDAPSLDVILEAALKIRYTISRHLAALREYDSQKAIGHCWFTCGEILHASRELAMGLDSSWRAVHRLSGKRGNATQKAGVRIGVALGTATKFAVLASIGARRAHEEFTAQMAAVDSELDSPERTARRVRLEALREARGRRQSEEGGRTTNGAAVAPQE